MVWVLSRRSMCRLSLVKMVPVVKLGWGWGWGWGSGGGGGWSCRGSFRGGVGGLPGVAGGPAVVAVVVGSAAGGSWWWSSQSGFVRGGGVRGG